MLRLRQFGVDVGPTQICESRVIYCMRAKFYTVLMKFGHLVPRQTFTRFERAPTIANKSCGKIHRSRKIVTTQGRESGCMKVTKTVVKRDHDRKPGHLLLSAHDIQTFA